MEDVLADTAAAWLLRGDGVLLGIGHVEFPSPLRKLHRGAAEGTDERRGYFYADAPIPVTLLVR